MTESEENVLSFVYASFLPPGMHQFLIYCPKTDRVFCKEVAIDLNSLELYPEFPEGPPKERRKKIRASIWRDWKEPTNDMLYNAFMKDIGVETFQP